MTVALVVLSFAAYRFISRVQPNGPYAKHPGENCSSSGLRLGVCIWRSHSVLVFRPAAPNGC